MAKELPWHLIPFLSSTSCIFSIPSSKIHFCSLFHSSLECLHPIDMCSTESSTSLHLIPQFSLFYDHQMKLFICIKYIVECPKLIIFLPSPKLMIDYACLKHTYTTKNYRCQMVNKYFAQQIFLCTICAQIVDRTFVHKRLTNISVDRWCVRLCTSCLPIYRNEKEKKIPRKSRKQPFRRMQAMITRKGHRLDSKRLTDVLVRKRSRGQIYMRLLSVHQSPFVVRLLSVCCPKYFAVYEI